MTDEQFKQLMDKLERIEALLRGSEPARMYTDRIPQHLWTEAERMIVTQFQTLGKRKTP